MATGLHGFEQVRRGNIPADPSNHYLVTPEGDRFRVYWDYETFRWICGGYEGGSIRSLVAAMRGDFPGIKLA